MRRTASIAAIALAAGTLVANIAPAADTPDTGVDVDLSAYSGLWYEIARTGAPFEQVCEGGVTARYAVEDDSTLSVLNRCDLGGGEVQRIEGTAEVINPNGNALNVTFEGQPAGTGANYLIEAVGPVADGQYRWAIVRGAANDNTTGWILAREPMLDDAVLAEARDAAAQAGLDPSTMKSTDQPPDSYRPDGQ